MTDQLPADNSPMNPESGRVIESAVAKPDTKVVKSVGRVFKILELFSLERRPMSAVQIARELNYPHTSALAILKSMQALGYLVVRDDWTFFPSHELLRVSQWIAGSLEEEQGVLNAMADLSEELGETINLSRVTGDFARIVHGIESTKSVGISVRVGAVMPLNAAHTGMVALAINDDNEVARIIRGLVERKYTEARLMTVRDTLKQVHAIRKARFSPGYDTYIPGIGAVCVAIHGHRGGGPFVLGVVGPSDRIRKTEKTIVAAMEKAVATHKLEFAYPPS